MGRICNDDFVEIMEMEINNWTDYWNLFDELCALLKARNKERIVIKLKEAQLHVNGLTDGWFEFLNLFEDAIKGNKEHLNSDEETIANNLIFGLKKSLLNR